MEKNGEFGFVMFGCMYFGVDGKCFCFFDDLLYVVLVCYDCNEYDWLFEVDLGCFYFELIVNWELLCDVGDDEGVSFDWYYFEIVGNGVVDVVVLFVNVLCFFIRYWFKIFWFIDIGLKVFWFMVCWFGFCWFFFVIFIFWWGWCDVLRVVGYCGDWLGGDWFVLRGSCGIVGY